MKRRFITLLCLVSMVFPSCNKDNEEENQSKDSVKCVFIGDSITELWARDENDPGFFTSHHYLNKGIGGETTTDILARFERDVTKIEPEAVVILAGINDIAQNDGYISNEDIMKNIVKMCERASSCNIKVILCSVLPAYQFVRNTSIKPVPLILDLNRQIKAYADSKSYPYVDYYSTLVDERGGLPAKYSEDGVHPNMSCYFIMENMIVEVINDTLE